MQPRWLGRVERLSKGVGNFFKPRVLQERDNSGEQQNANGHVAGEVKPLARRESETTRSCSPPWTTIQSSGKYNVMMKRWPGPVGRYHPVAIT